MIWFEGSVQLFSCKHVLADSGPDSLAPASPGGACVEFEEKRMCTCVLAGSSTSMMEMCILLMWAFRLPSFLYTQLQSIHGYIGPPELCRENGNRESIKGGLQSLQKYYSTYGTAESSQQRGRRD